MQNRDGDYYDRTACGFPYSAICPPGALQIEFAFNAAGVGVTPIFWHRGSMKQLSIFDVIASGDTARIIRVVDEAFKAAAREASFRAHALGIDVSDGRVEEDRRGRSVKPGSHDVA